MTNRGWPRCNRSDRWRVFCGSWESRRVRLRRRRYAVFFATFLYAVGFVGNFVVPKSLDAAPAARSARRSLIDLGLLGALRRAAQRDGAAGFKRGWTRFVPQPVERSTYVLRVQPRADRCCSGSGGRSAAWSGTSQTRWAAALLYAVFAFGWLLVLVTTFLINHFDLFGLRQVWLHLRGRPYPPLASPRPARTGSCAIRSTSAG